MNEPKYAGLTHRGRKRKRNEDTWAQDVGQGIFLVSDGMGGQAGGCLASRIVAEMLSPLVSQRVSDSTDIISSIVAEQLREAIAELSDRVYAEASAQPGLRGMGATVVLALVRDRHALIAHMGDSRAYLLREGKLQQITHDHSLVQLLIETGDITPQEATEHPSRGQITRYVGMPGEALPEVLLIDIAAGDRLLLCTDGLTGMVPEQELCDIMLNQRTPRQACRALIAAANEAGGLDNITALVVDVH